MRIVNKEIIIGSETQIRRCVRNIPEDLNWRWCYFGVDMEAKERIQRYLSGKTRYYYAKDLYNLSRECKVSFLNFIAKLSQKYKDNLCWWAGRLASKSPYQSDFFLLFCYFNLIKKYALGENQRDFSLFIIIENPYLQSLLHREATKLKLVKVMPVQYRIAAKAIYYSIKSILAIFLFLLRQIALFIINGYCKIKYAPKFCTLFNFNPEIILCTALEERSFEGGVFSDPYKMDFLADFYKKLGKKTLIASQVDAGFSLKSKILRGEQLFLLPTFYLKVKDFIKTIFMRPVLIKDNDFTTIDGVNYRPLFLSEYLQECSSASFWAKLCFHYAYCNYFSANKHVRFFIYLFENQPWEKMALLAIKESGRNIKTIGYQHTCISDMEINHFLGKDEYKFSPCPDYIFTNSSYYETFLQSAGFNSSKIINAGSLRYSNGRQPYNFNKIQRKTKENILFLLQPPLPRSLEVIYSMRNIFRKNGNLRLFIKPHPDLFNRKIRKAITSNIDADIITSLPLDEILPKMDLVVYSSTAAALEAVNMGIPICKIESEIIDLDILEGLGINPYKMTPGQKIDLDLVNFSQHMAISAINIINEPPKKEVWLSIL